MTSERSIGSAKQKAQAFFELAERFRSSKDPDDVKKVGDESGPLRLRQVKTHFIPSALSTPSSATAFPSFFVTTPKDPE
jgi:hypothetical protein